MESGNTQSRQYAKQSHIQAEMAKGAAEHLRSAGRAAVEAGIENINIADFGCSVGNNSTRDLQAAIDSIQAVKEDTKIAVYSVDLPSNDWKSLFENVQAGYGAKPNVFPYAVGNSFYTKMFPANHVHIGYSAVSLHWLSRTVPTNGHVVCQLDPEANLAAAKVAAEDWLTFLQTWAHQSASGAHFILVLPSLGIDAALRRASCVSASWKSMVADGIISQADLELIHFPVYLRSEEELRAPFESVPEIAAAFEILAVEETMVLSPRWGRLRQEGKLDELAESMALTFRTAASPAFRKELQHLSNVEALLDEWTSRTAKSFRQLFEEQTTEEIGTAHSYTFVFRKR